MLWQGGARREARSLTDRLFGLVRQEVEYRAAQSLEDFVPLPIECRAELGIGIVDAAPDGLPEHVRLYASLLRDEGERKRAFDAFLSSCRRTMARAIQRCFYSVLADASADRDAVTSDDDALQMPNRLYGARRTIAVDIVHRFLNVAHAFGGFAIVDDATTPIEDCIIIVYHRSTGKLLMPRPQDIVEQHWQATQHMLDLAVRVEPWIRDRRRRGEGALLLTRLQRWITIDTRGPHIHGHARERNVLRDLDVDREERSKRYWPSWPPRANMICTVERLRTALLWGRSAACTALRELDRTELDHIPNEPYYRNHANIEHVREHVWLHEAHERTMRDIEDDEIDEVDLFGSEG